MNIDFKEAILNRESRRTFENKEIPKEIIEAIQYEIKRINTEENLNIQLVIGDSSGFNSMRKTYGLLKGVENYLALIGNKDDINLCEKLGYYGEKLLLICESLGLSTCWVGGTYSKKDLPCNISDKETLDCVIVFGYSKNKGFKEKLIKRTTSKRKSLDELCHKDSNLPDWINEGLKLLRIAPSAMNRQPVIISYKNDEVRADIIKDDKFALYDLGIAKFHFQVGANCGKWQWGRGNIFDIDI